MVLAFAGRRRGWFAIEVVKQPVSIILPKAGDQCIPETVVLESKAAPYWSARCESRAMTAQIWDTTSRSQQPTLRAVEINSDNRNIHCSAERKHSLRWQNGSCLIKPAGPRQRGESCARDRSARRSFNPTARPPEPAPLRRRSRSGSHDPAALEDADRACSGSHLDSHREIGLEPFPILLAHRGPG